MGLKNNGKSKFFVDWTKPLSVELFEKVERRLAAKKELLEDVENEYNLLELQAFDLYREHVSYFDFYESVINGAGKWLKMVKNNVDADGKKINKRKRYEEKGNYEWLTKLLIDLLGVNDIQITQIVDYNFGQAYEINFTSHGHEWYLSVPRVQSIPLQSYKLYGANCFKLSLVHRSNQCYLEIIEYTFEEDDLKDIMQKGIQRFVGTDVAFCKESEQDNAGT